MNATRALVVGALAASLAAACGGGSIDERLSVESGSTVRVDVDFGSAQNWDRGAVKIGGHDEGDLLVRSQTSGWGSYAVQLGLTEQGGGPALLGRVGGPLYSLFGGPTVRIEIMVPKGARIEARVVGGPLSIGGTAGAVIARGGDYPIDVSDALGVVELTTRRGDVRVGAVDGDVKIDSERGAVSVSDVTGAVAAKSEYGSLNLEKIGGAVTVAGDRETVVVTEVQGAVKVTTRDGRIELTKVGGPVAATSHEGPIRTLFSGSPAGQFRTDSGTIHVRFPAESALDLEARTQRGKIRLDASFWLEGDLDEREAAGQINGGGDLLKLDSRRGSIDIDVP